MTYTVWYKPVGSLRLESKIDNVLADGVIESVGVRWFILPDNTRIEIDMTGMLFRFSPDRAKAAEANKQPTK